jgi:hypothetical protein
MDERKPSIPLGKFHLRSTSRPTSADNYPPSAALNHFACLERQPRCGHIEPSPSDFSDRRSVASYYRTERELSRGFLIALCAMGFAPEQSTEPPKLPGSAHAQELKPTLNGGTLSAEKSESPKEN